MDVPVFIRRELEPGARIAGMAILLDPYSTTVIEPGWELVIDPEKAAHLHRVSVRETLDQTRSGPRTQAIELELFTNRFMSLAEEMGAMLQRTSLSVNVKERLDFSCALVDPKGYLVANAPHIPVHLGSLGVCVRKVLQVASLQPGDTLITNHPAFGGSHLPDITLITPVFTPDRTLVAFVVNRSHHAEIGGIQPASMPAHARNLEEEGVVIPPMHLVEAGQTRWNRIREVLTVGKYPSRLPEENLADLNAALAANRAGSAALLKMVDRYGLDSVLLNMRRLREHAALKMKETIGNLRPGKYVALEKLDDGTPLKASISLNHDQVLIDFTGSGSLHPGNLNANEAIVNSVVIYVLRLLIGEPIPLNDGILDPVRIILPEGILNPSFPTDPAFCPPVVGGNVETSQRLTDTLLKAFGLIACSQGTMNNLLFGNREFSYYETICGGCGAGPGFHGASAVHHHMTNTRITDPEVLEHRHPVRLHRFEIRNHSGGRGTYNGGDGVIREMEFLRPVKLSLLSQHRIEAPYGIEGGEPGLCGRQWIIRANGSLEMLEGIDEAEMNPGDRVHVETPGGGGYGPV